MILNQTDQHYDLFMIITTCCWYLFIFLRVPSLRRVASSQHRALPGRRQYRHLAFLTAAFERVVIDTVGVAVAAVDDVDVAVVVVAVAVVVAVKEVLVG